MAGLATMFGRAVAAHRQACDHLAAARRALVGTPAPPESPQAPGIAAALGATGDALTTAARTAAALFHGPVPIRLGEARVGGAGSGFPAVVPLTGGTHLAIDADARDPRVAALLRVLVVRLLAAAPPGSVRVLAIDIATLGATFLPLRPLVDAGALAAPATTEAEAAAVLDAAEAYARAAHQGGGPPDELLVLVVTAPAGVRDLGRLAGLTHAGSAAGVCVLLAGYPAAGAAGLPAPPPLGATTLVRLTAAGYAHVGDPPGAPFSADGTGLAAPVVLDGDPQPASIELLADRFRAAAPARQPLGLADVLPPLRWSESSGNGLRTVVGRFDGPTGAGRQAGGPATYAFDDATPHWLVGGRTGSGKTVFLLDLLYGLAARYSPEELALYLLDFKEGVSFSEFVPTGRDPSWIPHARAVGIESDREYGVAVLRELRRELNRRATALKRYGVTKLSDLPRDDDPVPRILAVIDEFQVLFAGNDSLAREAVTLLEELARKGRSYGVHLVLASQSTAGIEALYGKAEPIFGQFPLRVALPGGSGVLGPLNDAAADLPIGCAVMNTAAGVPGANTIVRFPDAHASGDLLATLRHELWRDRPPGSRPPAVFKGYEAAHVADDPTARGLAPGGSRPLALVGRVVDVHLSTAYFALDASPGRHLAVVGTSPAGADVVHAATVTLARQHQPGTARFLLAPLVASADAAARDTAATLVEDGHPVVRLDAAGLREQVRQLAAGEVSGEAAVDGQRTYLVVFGMDAASGVLSTPGQNFRSGLDDLRQVLRQGPALGVHLLGWWRGLRRLADDLGGTHNRDDMACLVALNVPGGELGLYLGTPDLAYQPRANRALLVDRHDQRVRLVVPFVRPGHEPEEAY